MDIIELILGFTLYFADKRFEALMIGLVYILHSREGAIKILSLLFASITFNVILKEIWQIPLQPGVNPNAYAFPSGHMQSFTIIAVSIALYVKQLWVRACMPVMIFLTAASIQHAGFHGWVDLAGGFCIGFILATLSWIASKSLKFSNQNWCLLLFAINIFMFAFLTPDTHRYLWLYKNIGSSIGLVGFLLTKQPTLLVTWLTTTSCYLIYCTQYLERMWGLLEGFGVILAFMGILSIIAKILEKRCNKAT